MEANQKAGTRGQASLSKATPRDLPPPVRPHFSIALQPHKKVPWAGKQMFKTWVHEGHFRLKTQQEPRQSPQDPGKQVLNKPAAYTRPFISHLWSEAFSSYPDHAHCSQKANTKLWPPVVLSMVSVSGAGKYSFTKVNKCCSLMRVLASLPSLSPSSDLHCQHWEGRTVYPNVCPCGIMLFWGENSRCQRELWLSFSFLRARDNLVKDTFPQFRKETFLPSMTGWQGQSVQINCWTNSHCPSVSLYSTVQPKSILPHVHKILHCPARAAFPMYMQKPVGFSPVNLFCQLNCQAQL